MIPGELQLHLTGLGRHTTEELLLLAQQGDALAFEQLYRLTCPAVRSFVQRRAFRRLEVDDVVQEAFCRVWECKARFTCRSAAMAYLFGVARNVIREELKFLARRAVLVNLERVDQIGPQHNGDPVMGIEVCDGSLAAARSTLSARQAAAVRLVYDEQESPQEAAQQLGCTEQAIRCRVQQSLRKLRDCLERQSGPASPTAIRLGLPAGSVAQPVRRKP